MTARDTTMTFTCFVFFDMFNALSCRWDFIQLLTDILPILWIRIWSDPYLFGGSGFLGPDPRHLKLTYCIFIFFVLKSFMNTSLTFIS
jgi:hypothetical protein